jgi:two-component system cell cycle sensor histidine kinase/response regulator CckA
MWLEVQMLISGLTPSLQGPFSFSKRLAYLAIASLTIIVVLRVASPNLLRGLLSSAYMPHLYCYLGNTALAWTQVTADSLIGLGYLSISGTLVYLVYRGSRDLPFHGLFLAFVLFIIACGASHFLDVVTVWKPVYVLEATVKVLTALASVTTAFMLPFAVPQVMAIVQKARTSDERRELLEATLLERDAAGAALKEANALMEQKVLERTKEITKVNEALEVEISERRRNEQELRRSEERFSKAFHGSPLPMTISTRSGHRYLDVNDAFLALVGVERHSVVGRTASDLGFWVDPQERLTMFKQLTEQGRVLCFPAKILANGGAIRDAAVWAERIEIGGQSCVLAITQDTTETNRLQAQFQQAQKMEAIGRLAGGMAHDFNNILGVIMGYSDLSQEGSDPEAPVAKNLTQIKVAAQRGATLTRQLLAFSRPRPWMGQPPPSQGVSLRVLDLNAVVNDVTKMLTRVVGEDITLLFRPSVPLGSIVADKGQIEQVLMNLVINARDAMPDCGEITIETSRVALDENYVRQHEPVIAGEYVMLVVRDTGSGMSAATKARIFEPFFTTKEPGKGTGLGLASVYGIVKQSSGYIWVYSELGRGTTFKLYFPWVQEDVENASTTLVGNESVGGSETILLVEDEPSLRSITAASLKSVGYTVLEAEDPAEAIRLLETCREPIHLLLTDVIMPGMNGLELSKRLRLKRPGLKVIFISGYSGEQVAKQIADIPGAVLVEKPFSKVALVNTVRAVLHPSR